MRRRILLLPLALSWAAAEPVVNGLMMIGAPHLEPGQMSLLLDLLISDDEAALDVS